MWREFTYRDVPFTVDVNTFTIRKLRWRFELPSGKFGEGISSGVEAAFKRGEDEARHAIAGELDG